MNKVIAKTGDCFASITKQYGFEDPKVIYEHDANTALRAVRNNMHVLQTGDQINVPAQASKTVPIGQQGKLMLTIKGHVTLFETSIEEYDGNPLKGMPYELEVSGNIRKGVTDNHGKISQVIDAAAKKGILRVFLDSLKKNVLMWTLEFGALPPHTSMIGIQARLNNLGYFCANETGNIDSSTQEAIIAFKTRHGLNSTATVDYSFTQKLLQEYGF